MRTATSIIIYSGLILVGGVAAFVMAPAGSSALTALLVPLIYATILDILAVTIILQRDTPRSALGPLRIVLLLMVIFIAAMVPRALATWNGIQAYDKASIEFEDLAVKGLRANTPEARAGYLAEQDAPTHDKRYLLYIVGGMLFLSIIFFFALRYRYSRYVMSGAL